jgi:hypothetical protein
MLALPLHTGTEHPDLLLIVVSSLLAFLTGVGLGTYGDRFREFLRARADGSDSTK